MDALASFLQDVRYGARVLWRTPLFTAVAVASVAGGMTAAIGIFAVTNAIVARPFAGFSADVHRIFTSDRGGSTFGNNSLADVQDFAAAGVFSATCAVTRLNANVSAGTSSSPREGALVSDGCFAMLDLRAAAGRLTLERGAPQVVISHALWQRVFAGEPAAILIAPGSVLGSALGVVAAIAFQSNFIGLAPIQPAAGIPAMAIMAMTAVGAALVPALRAARVDPNVALRTD